MTDPAPMGWREPTLPELDDIRTQLGTLAWLWARRLADLTPDQRPWSPEERGLAPEVEQSALTARRRAHELLAQLAQANAAADARAAGEALPDGTREWTREQVVGWLASQGAPLRGATWSGYVTRGQAPAPLRRVGRTPLWDADAVRSWHSTRPGRGWRAGHGDQAN